MNRRIFEKENMDLQSPRPKRKRPSVEGDENTGVSRNGSVIQALSPFTVVTQQPHERENDGDLPGTIKTIRLENFMCHGNFEIHFNPRVNFVIGLNGSGKSAIQTAIVVGLGGRANITNRSTSVKGLVKQNCVSGTVSITLRNTGPRSFEHEAYGNEITVKRHLTKSGSNSYKICNERGKVVSTKKDELDKMLLHFQIQPSNPVAILNQDMSKTFFNAVDAKDRYKLFKKATLIDDAQAILSLISEDLKYQEQLLNTKEKAVENNFEEIKEMEEKLKIVHDLNANKARRAVLENELKCSKKLELERAKEKMEATRTVHIRTKSEYESKVEDIRNNLRTYESSLQDLRNKLQNINTVVKSMEEERQEVENEVRINKQLLHTKDTEYESLALRLKRKESDLQQLQNMIGEFQNCQEERTRREEEAKKKIEVLEQEISELENDFSLCSNNCTQSKSSENELIEKLKEEQRSIAEYRNHIQANNKGIERIKNGESNLKVYGSWMPELIQRIQAAEKRGKFTAMPKGPVGSYIKVNDSKWIPAIESYLKSGLLSSFYVNDPKDRNVLYKIMEEVIPRNEHKPAIYTGKFIYQLFGTLKQQEAVCHPYFNMYRAMTISDPVIANFFIDTARMETILLIPSNEECYKLSRPENVPPRCVKAINLNADEFIPYPNFKCYSNMGSVGQARYLQQDTSQMILNLQRDNEELTALLRDKESIINSLTVSIKQQHSEVTRFDNLLAKLNSSITTKKQQLRKCREVIRDEGPSLRQHEEELEQIQQEVETLKQKISEKEQEKIECQRKVKELDKKLRNVKAKCAVTQGYAIENEINALEGKIQDCVESRVKLLTDIREQDVKIQQLELRTNDIISKLQNLCETIEMEHAGITREIKEIEYEINVTDACIAQLELQAGGLPASFEDTLWEKKRHLEKLNNCLELVRNRHKKFLALRNSREHLFEEVRNKTANVVMERFHSVLQSRNYKGKLTFEHDDEKLFVNLATASGKNGFLNTNLLSGGERSFTTVGFIMSLWAAMDLPFYSMDEFDIYMDALNRKAITELLITYALNGSKSQFIFLTPLDISNIKPNPMIEIHRLANPRTE